MSRSSGITPASKSEVFQFCLASGRAERRFRAGLGLLVLLFSGVSLWRYPAFTADESFFLAVSAVSYFLWELYKPFNGALSGLQLRFDGEQWWLGSAEEWRAVSLVGHRCFGDWLITAQFCDSRQRFRLWLFSSGEACSLHRRCRLMLG